MLLSTPRLARSIIARRALCSSAPALMRKELETKLREDFPTLFSELQDPCCIDDGWEPLLRRLCRDIQHDKTVRFAQIKEKYGGLRAYTTGGTAEIDEKVDQAEEESFQTCESCGKEGGLAATASGWDFTACQGCFDLRIANGEKCTWA